MDGVTKCETCGSTVAANGECPDCNAPEDDDEELDEYVCWNEEELTATPPGPDAERSRGAQDRGSRRVLPFPKPKPATLTAAERYAAGNELPRLTPARVAELDRRYPVRYTAPVLRSSSIRAVEATRHAPSIRTF